MNIDRESILISGTYPSDIFGKISDVYDSCELVNIFGKSYKPVVLGINTDSFEANLTPVQILTMPKEEKANNQHTTIEKVQEQNRHLRARLKKTLSENKGVSMSLEVFTGIFDRIIKSDNSKQNLIDSMNIKLQQSIEKERKLKKALRKLRGF